MDSFFLQVAEFLDSFDSPSDWYVSRGETKEVAVLLRGSLSPVDIHQTGYWETRPSAGRFGKMPTWQETIQFLVEESK